jgi:hypothetical protein
VDDDHDRHTRLLSDESAEAQSLVLFLKNLHEALTGDLEPSAMDIGKNWMICRIHARDEPDSEISIVFMELNGAWVPAAAGGA